MPHKPADVKQISEMLGVKPATIYKWVRQGKIPSCYLGRLVRFDPAEIDRWVGKNKAWRPAHSVDLDSLSNRRRIGRRE